MRKYAAGILALALAVAQPALAQAPPPASFEEAMSLFDDGNFVEAKKIADNYAEKNDARAFLMLGTMFQKGLGVEVDLKQAQIWFRKGAEAGDTDCTALSRNVASQRNRPEGECYRWSSLVAASG